MKLANILLPLAIIASLTACNKDDIIEQDGPNAPAGDGNFNPATESSSAFQTQVFAYMPAPGQFINDTQTGGFTGNETTADKAREYALGRLKEKKFVSLGAFGGYIIVGFDHSIAARGGDDYDFAILGNAITTSNEPGIVSVMQDTNGNGLPDDEWFELRGSDTDVATTRHNYAVTYHRPAEPQSPVRWTDSEGNSGMVEYLSAYHKQPYYYPAWVTEESYTLTGTRLEARNSLDTATGSWTNAPFAWGYADNIGSDTFGDGNRWTGFKIANAMKADGSAAGLTHIDFVKVQTAVLAQSGWIGENSCEVLSFADCSMQFQ